MANQTHIGEDIVSHVAFIRRKRWIGYAQKKPEDVYFEVVDEYKLKGLAVCGRCRYPNDARAWTGDLSE